MPQRSTFFLGTVGACPHNPARLSQGFTHNTQRARHGMGLGWRGFRCDGGVEFFRPKLELDRTAFVHHNRPLCGPLFRQYTRGGGALFVTETYRWSFMPLASHFLSALCADCPLCTLAIAQSSFGGGGGGIGCCPLSPAIRSFSSLLPQNCLWKGPRASYGSWAFPSLL